LGGDDNCELREGEKRRRRGREDDDIEVLVHRHRSNTDNLHLETSSTLDADKLILNRSRSATPAQAIRKPTTVAWTCHPCPSSEV
jgi:hypothetical protein